jgi:hypothetical protein
MLCHFLLLLLLTLICFALNNYLETVVYKNFVGFIFHFIVDFFDLINIIVKAALTFLDIFLDFFASCLKACSLLQKGYLCSLMVLEYLIYVISSEFLILGTLLLFDFRHLLTELKFAQTLNINHAFIWRWPSWKWPQLTWTLHFIISLSISLRRWINLIGVLTSVMIFWSANLSSPHPSLRV